MLKWCGFCSVRWLTVSLLCRSFRLTLAIQFVANLQQRNRYRAMVSIVEWARQYLGAFVWQLRPRTNWPNYWLAARNFWLGPVNTAKKNMILFGHSKRKVTKNASFELFIPWKIVQCFAAQRAHNRIGSADTEIEQFGRAYLHHWIYGVSPFWPHIRWTSTREAY